jgi:hypothetical protein
LMLNAVRICCSCFSANSVTAFSASFWYVMAVLSCFKTV